MIKIETAADAIAYIHSRHKWSKTPSFKRINALLDALGHPERANQYIHVTGTNGKGSTSKMITRILRTAGLQVGLFTSPFIERFNERIQDNDGQIKDADLLAAVQTVAPIAERLDQQLENGGPTEFETLTATMFVYFQQHPVDVIVLEVGVGGTWDSTEVIPDKLAAVITNVGYDHMRILGNTLAEIAEAKAGILQPKRPVIIGPLALEAKQVVIDRAAQIDAPVVAFGVDFKNEPQAQQALFGETFNFVGTQMIPEIHLALTGAYQQINASVAIETALTVAPKLHIQLDATIIRTALADVFWPARFEKIADNPLTIIDGAHNPQGIAALKTTLEDRFVKQQQPFHLIVGILADKHFGEMLEDLATIPNVQLHVVHFDAPNQRTDISKSALQALPEGLNIDYQSDWYALYQHLQSQGQPIVFTGSLYFVSEVRSKIKTNNEIGETNV
ncbi:dihydrofolate synthase/folylpolyglutamate synthase [Weissella uvarum]|uniref:bifunctional folylpolyglutamate synthase/dihydrofolate synthase n=1 Tax=Weissella uvarum TaxID=1479233 RepID=UPI00195F4ABA|nr:folylpolyglutamate synthase/dihydrofolate synthase family protein [Weissella uvarum]MBM7616502.1 dihydrofolate synthase/folylpolyglutamate synthase [Weissella uvarum]MCM0595037.1 bifunctional folylpolyglutamate synthase/dihydrofolate synthase [Weissella uvarum]